VKSATTCQQSAFWWDSQNKMAQQLSSEDLTDWPEFLILWDGLSKELLQFIMHLIL